MNSLTPNGIIDYQILMDTFAKYKKPRSKISRLLRSGKLIRIKKGLYVRGPDIHTNSYSRETLANLIYGPSYISIDTALSYHGLIPERVESFTSVTTGRSRRFQTPVGLFTYHTIPMEAYSTGCAVVERAGTSFLMALAEKALADKIRLDRNSAVRTPLQMKAYLFDNLRIDEDGFADLEPDRLAGYAILYGSARIRFAADLMRSMKSAKNGRRHE